MEATRESSLARGFEKLRESRTWGRVLEAAEKPGGVVEVGGLVGSATSMWLAALGCLGPRFILVVTSATDEAENLARDLSFFLRHESIPVHFFPAWGNLGPGVLARGGGLDQRVLAARFSVLRDLAESTLSNDKKILVAPAQALIEEMPSVDSFRSSILALRAGDEVDRESLARLFVERELERVSMVEASGEFSMRGEIIDVFPLGVEVPIRVELFGETIESIRTFDPASQRSIDRLEKLDLHVLRRSELVTGGMKKTSLQSFLREAEQEPLVVEVDPPSIQGRVDRMEETNDPPDAENKYREFCKVRRDRLSLISVHRLPIATGSGSVNFHTREIDPPKSREVLAVVERIATLAAIPSEVHVLCQNEAVRDRFSTLIPFEDEPFSGGRVQVEVGELMHGFVFPELSLTAVSHTELFGGKAKTRPRGRPNKKRRNSRPIENFLELELGDLVVHLVHGIAKYTGMDKIEKDGSTSEFHKLTFKDGVLLYVPVTKTDLIQKYVGVKGHRPQLSKLGGKGFTRKKQKVAEAIADFAAELLEVQAMRAARRGTAFPPDSFFQHEFEAAFPYEETDDQLDAAASIKENQESDRPMDRLLCGDVGYGKTELAMRAAFKAVEAGCQVAVLVPTTVLAQQHHDTFRERMADFPVVIEMLSRFRTGREQRDIIGRASEGKVDILIGTHRIVSPDVKLPSLGLVIIDEEQRFGVGHKQRFKEIKATVDVLTLSATPIPRTLHMALVGLRDISTLATPPRGRQSVHTTIVPPEPEMIRDAIRRELDRDGQVFFLHNRVKTIDKTARMISALVPEARLAIVHGQMQEHMLEDRMLEFIDGRLDVLVCTTIIESGLDIPNVNTIFIDDAQRFGLSELHQLRGRVGRYNRQAFAYLIVPKDKALSDIAMRRLRAIQEYNDLGAGFRIAMRDLEIRGAGNILGAEQSGEIAAVGYDLYTRILARAVERIQSGEVIPRASEKKDQGDGRSVPKRSAKSLVPDKDMEDDVEIDLPGSRFLPDDYVPDMKGRMEAYRKLSLARSEKELTEVSDELADRYGTPPPQVVELVALSRLREVCRGTGIQRISSTDLGLVVIRVRERAEALAALPVPRGADRMMSVDAITVHLHLRGRKEAHPIRVCEVLQELLGVSGRA